MNNTHTECEKFAARLVAAMLEAGQQSLRKSATGVTTSELKAIAGVTNEMARRYTLGQAWPEHEKIAKIAKWLGVREAWLRYGEDPKRLSIVTEDSAHHSTRAVQSSELNKELLAEVITLVDNIKTMHRLDISARVKAEAIVSAYEDIVKKGLKSGELMGPVQHHLTAATGHTA